MDSKEIIRRIKSATVAIASMNPDTAGQPFTVFGSGFCVDPQGLIVTCRHVLDAMMEVSALDQIARSPKTKNPGDKQDLGSIRMLVPHAIFYDMNHPSGNLVAFPSRVAHMGALVDYDLALFKLLPHTHMPNGYPHIEVEDFNEINEGDEVGLCGFPLGNFLHNQLGTVTSSFTKGIISSIIPHSNISQNNLKGFQLNVTATNGNSGGPVFSLKSGKVFGVLQRGVANPSDQIIHGLTKAEPIYPVIEENFFNSIKSVE